MANSRSFLSSPNTLAGTERVPRELCFGITACEHQYLRTDKRLSYRSVVTICLQSPFLVEGVVLPEIRGSGLWREGVCEAGWLVAEVEGC